MDLVGPATRLRLREVIKKYEHTMTVSAKQHGRTMALLRKINAIAQGKHSVVGVVGYPNTGKSSVINALKGKGAAPVSPKAGYTRGLQKVKVSDKLMVIDTPGVIPYDERKNVDLQILIASKNAEELSDPEGVAMRLIQALDGQIERHYGLEVLRDVDETLDNLAIKLNLVKRGGLPDPRRASIHVIQDWQRGKIKF